MKIFDYIQLSLSNIKKTKHSSLHFIDLNFQLKTETLI